MNPESRDQWINEILNEVFLAVIAWEPLRNALIFKGARILNLTSTVNGEDFFREVADFDAGVILCFVQGEHVRAVSDLALEGDPIAFAGCRGQGDSLSASPWAAREARESRPPGPRRMWAKATASSAPASGPTR